MLAEKYRKEGYAIASEDEATFGLIPSTTRGWAKRGSKPVAIQNFQHKCINVFGARTADTFEFMFAKKKNQRTFIAFLKKVLKRFGKVCLFIDSAPCHKGKILERFEEEHRQTLHIERFLKYCPELNPVEQCWKPARQEINNRFNPSIPAMEYHLKKVFQNPFLLPIMFKYLFD